MPDEQTWAGFFDPSRVLVQLGLDRRCQDVADFGCGYGTFTIPAARMICGVVHAIDTEPTMLETTGKKAEDAGLRNVQTSRRDLVTEGTGLPDESIDYVMLFNNLHAESPDLLLREAFRILSPGGKLGIVHWNYDPGTPRGPTMAIRPRPEQCRNWAEQTGFRMIGPGLINLPPYHYGFLFYR